MNKSRQVHGRAAKPAEASAETAPDQRPSPAPEAPAKPAPSEPVATVVQPDNPLASITLKDLPAPLRAAAERVGWPELTRVQAAAIPYLLAGRDMMIQSRTGSGKTGAFILPILQRIDPNLNACQALVLVPTRELAQQVHGEAEKLAAGSNVRPLCVYGGTAYGPQLDALRAGAHVVIGTPGRILDHLLRKTLSFADLKILVFDEADRMLSMGFYPDMKEISRYLPRRRSGFMFSATYPISVVRLAAQFLDKPGTLSLSSEQVYVSETEHVYYDVPGMDKDRALVRLIEVENPESAIIFCNTKMRVNYVATVLRRFGYDADQLTADLSQPAREKVLDRLRAASLRFLVATDIAARGIDVINLSHVINYEVPEEAESYIHRTGRTGRAGASGEAISLVDFGERIEFNRIVKRFSLDVVKRELPTDEDVQTLVAQRLTATLEARLRTLDKLQVERLARFLPMARGLGENDDELTLIAMVLDDIYHGSLHSAPPVPGDSPPAAKGASKPAGEPSQGPARRRRR